MDLLVLEWADEAPQVKSSSSKLVGTMTSNVRPSNDRKMSVSKRLIGNGQVSPTRSGMASPTTPGAASVTILNDNDREKDILYPFKITHLGQNTSYTLYTLTSHERDKARLDKGRTERELWKEGILNAKKEHSSAMNTRNSEPFKLRVLADLAFGYDSNKPLLPVFTEGTALDRAIREAEVRTSLVRGSSGGSSGSSVTLTDSVDPAAANSTVNIRPLTYSIIHCGVSFVYADGNEYCMLGLDSGVYIHDRRTGSAWRQCLKLTNVTQINVIQDMNVVIVLANRNLAYYHLDGLISKKDSSSNSNSKSRTEPKGYKLSEKNVGFFSIGLMRDRTLLFYKKYEGLNSVFKILEPVREKGSQKKRSKVIFPRESTISSTEFFKDVDKFYIPSESSGISLFKSTFAVHTTKGFELMSLETKSTPRTLPITTATSLLNILKISKSLKYMNGAEAFRKKIENSKPLGMFRIATEVIILCYEDFVLYADNEGSLRERSPAFSFLCKAKKVCLQLPFLISFGEEMIEVRRVDKSGQLKQVITGKDIRCIDSKEGQIKAALAHPIREGRQLVVELIGNEFVVEDDTNSLIGL